MLDEVAEALPRHAMHHPLLGPGQPSHRGIAVTVEVHDAAVARLTRTEQRVVHRVTRECLRNLVKHADATRVTVTLSGAGEPEGIHDVAVERTDAQAPVVLAIEDDGVGFDPQTLPSREGHFGVRVLADLATDVGAVLQVSSSPQGGTRWRLALPADGTPS